METMEKTMEKLAVKVTKEVRLTKEAIDEAKNRLARLGFEAEAYNEAWNSYASISVMELHLDKLANIVADQDAKLAENYIRFVIYQIENSTDKETLERSLEEDRSTGNLILDGKVTLYGIFKKFLSYLD